MNDVFGNLVSRSRPAREGEGTFLRPRLPSLFEAPAAFDPSLEFNSPFEPSRGLGTETEKSGRRRSRPEADRSGHPEEDALQAASPEPGSVAEREENDSTGKNFRNRVGSEEEDRYARREEPAGQFRARQPQVPAGREESDSRASARSKAEQAAGPPEDQAASPMPADGHAAPDETHVLRPLLLPYRLTAKVPPQDPRLAAFPGQGRALPGGHDPGEERPAAPVVRVSIGRIEVRAVFPAPPSAVRPAAAPRPKLSLDEYLRQRNEGKR
jgi:hypothetical protein